MAKVSNVNILIPNVATSGTAYMLYYLKETLKSAGWKVLAASDGTTLTNYPGGTTGADRITSPESGTNGMNNTSAWFRITDPDSSREFVFMRGSSAIRGVIKYSRLTKFESGSPNATTLPTTGTGGDGIPLIPDFDMPNLDSNVTTVSSATIDLMTTATAARLHVIAETTPTNGVYSWYIYAFQAVTNTLLFFYSQEAVAVGSCSPSDQDPSYLFLTNNSNAFFNNVHSGVMSSAALRTWFKYGLTGNTFHRAQVCIYVGGYYLTNLNYQIVPQYTNTVLSNNSYDDFEYTIPMLVYSGNPLSLTAIKGFSTNIRWGCKSMEVKGLKLINRGQEDASLYVGTGTYSLFVVPWTSENVDINTGF